jgi:protein-S-isoprenylcysteine O-methyltransferase Ste14
MNKRYAIPLICTLLGVAMLIMFYISYENITAERFWWMWGTGMLLLIILLVISFYQMKT